MSNFIITGRRWPVVLLILIVTTVTAAMPALAGEKQTMLVDPWDTSTVDPLEGGSSLSIVTDGNNHPHISYFGFETADDTSRFGLKYAWWDGAKWVIEFIEGVGKTDKAETSIALDSQGNPHISYYHAGTRDLRYAYFDEGIQDWVRGAVDETGDVGITNSLRLDSNDLPHIAYWDNTLELVRYASSDGTVWSFSTVEDLTCTSPWDKRVSLALDSKNLPHVSYHDCALPSKLKYAMQVSSNWDPIEVQAGNNSGLSSSIEVDSQDRPHISYRSGDTAGGLMYAYFDGDSWNKSDRIDNDFLWGKSTSLELDSGSDPRIAYTFWPVQEYPPEFTKEFRFTYLAGDQQTIEVIESADPTSEKAEIALAIDGDGNYHVAYWDDVTNLLKYGKRGALNQYIFLPFVLR